MRKGFLMVLAVALVAVLAAPAVAGTDINGFYRAKGYVTNFDLPAVPAIKNDMPTGGYVEQRFRMRFSFGEENVKAVAFFEIDFGAWGDAAGNTLNAQNNTSANQITSTDVYGAQRNSGGALGGDRINLETKNVYVWFKVPDTSLDFTVGLQSQTDTMQGLFYGAADMAGIFATGKYEPVNWKLGWARFYENNTSNWDDMTLYMGHVSYSPSKELKLGFGVYVIQDAAGKVSDNTYLPYSNTFAANTALNGKMTALVDNVVAPNTKIIYTIPIDFAYNASWGALSGFFLYQFGTVDFMGSSRADTDISAWAVDLRFDANAGPGKFFIEGLLLSGGDNSGNKYQSMVTTSDLNGSPGGNSFFSRLDYQILMSNADDINQNTCLIGCASAAATSSPGNGGRGMWTIGAGYSMKVAEKTTMKVGAGYLAAVKKLQLDRSDSDTDMGWELNANVNYNIMKGLDFGLYAAYAGLGDYFKGGGPQGTVVSSGSSANNDPDSLWTGFFRLNYAF